jgi:hypothetical protein
MNYDDEHAGMGGSYILDPETGKRTLVERTGAVEPTPEAPADAPAAETQSNGN